MCTAELGARSRTADAGVHFRAGAAAGPLHEAFFAVDARIVVVVARVPLLAKGYAKLTKLLARQVALPEKGSKPRPRCSIM